MYGRIVVPLDGSETAEAILPFAEKIVGPAEGEIVLVRVVEPISPAEMMATAGVVAPDTFALRQLEASQYLAKVEEGIKAKGIRARTGLRSGTPAAEIVAAVAAWDADLVAMTTHGRSGLPRILFGSVAEAVLRASPVPVLMVRTTATTATRATEANS